MGSPAPPAASVAENPAAQPEVDGDSKEGVSAAAEEKKPDLSTPSFEDLDQFEDIDIYKKYEADYTYRLMAKYFSQKNMCGGDIFEGQVTIDGEIIKASRWPSTSSYVDPLSVSEDLNCCGISICKAEEAATISNGKQPFKKPYYRRIHDDFHVNIHLESIAMFSIGSLILEYLHLKSIRRR